MIHVQFRPRLALIAPLLALPMVAACVPETGATAITTSAATVTTAGNADLPDVAGENCIKELARLANRPAGEISVQRVEVTDAGPTHYLMIQSAAAPWICKTLPNGDVVDLMYSQEG